MFSHKAKLITSFSIVAIFLFGYAIPEPKIIPVENASVSDWHKDTFWYEPWGSSGVHKGIDIFAKKGTPLLSTTSMLILYRGEINKGGKVIVGLGPKWRLHYFAHLDEITPGLDVFSKIGTQIGTVGDSGNAQGKAPHLHYSILSLVPRPWKIDSDTQGFKKAFYLDPGAYLTK